MSVDRPNIHALARQIEASGRPFSVSFSGESTSASDQITFELYALTAVLVERIVDRAKAQGNFASLPTSSTVNFSTVLGSRLEKAADTELRSLNNGSADAFKIFKRFKQILPSYTDDPRNYINRGIGTAMLVMESAIDAIPKLYSSQLGIPQESLDPNALAEVARNSYPTIVQLAMTDIGFIDGFSSKLRNKALGFIDKGVNPNLFELREDGNGILRLAINSSETLGKNGEALGCPAMVNFGSGSAVRGIWDLFVDNSAAIYGNLSPKKNTKELFLNPT